LGRIANRKEGTGDESVWGGRRDNALYGPQYPSVVAEKGRGRGGKRYGKKEQKKKKKTKTQNTRHPKKKPNQPPPPM